MSLWEILQLASVILSPVFAAGGAYGATRVRLSMHEKRLDGLDANLERAHERIDSIFGRDNHPHFIHSARGPK